MASASGRVPLPCTLPEANPAAHSSTQSALAAPLLPAVVSPHTKVAAGSRTSAMSQAILAT